MASPHVAGIVGADGQKCPALVAAQAERHPREQRNRAGGRMHHRPEPGTTVQQCWGNDATGHGLATADAALAGTPDGAGKRR